METDDVLARQSYIVLLRYEHNRRTISGLLLHLMVQFDMLFAVQFGAGAP